MLAENRRQRPCGQNGGLNMGTERLLKTNGHRMNALLKEKVYKRDNIATTDVSERDSSGTRKRWHEGGRTGGPSHEQQGTTGKPAKGHDYEEWPPTRDRSRQRRGPPWLTTTTWHGKRSCPQRRHQAENSRCRTKATATPRTDRDDRQQGHWPRRSAYEATDCHPTDKLLRRRGPARHP